MSKTGEFLQRHAAEDPRLGIVLRLANLLSAQVSLDELIALIMAGCSELLAADRSTLFLLSDDGTYLWSKYAQGDEVREIRVRVGEGIAGWVAQTGRPVNVKDVYKDHRFDRDWDVKNGYRTRSMLCQPIRNRDGDIIGVAQVLNKHHGYFTVDDAIMLRTIMAMAAISLVNARLYNALLARNMELVQAQRDLRARIREIDLLYIIERDAAAAVDLEAAIDILLRRLGETLPCELIQVALQAQDGAVITHRWRPVSGEEIERQRHERPVGFTAIAMREKSEFSVDSLAEVMVVQHSRAEGFEPPPNGFCAVLKGENRVLGALGFYGRGIRPSLDEHDQKLMSLVATRAARFIDTRRRRTEEERESRLAALGGAIATILHDFKTPMTVASGYAQMMVRTEDQAKRKEMAQTVLRQLEQVNHMSRDVLAFARGQTELLVQKVHVNDFLTEAEEMLAQVFAQTDVRIEVQRNYRGVARFDRLKLIRVVQNMARNAREAIAMVETPRQHVFRFVVDAEGEQLVLTFSDTGTGVPPEFRHRMFEAFETHGKSEGTGLGLAMVKRFAQSHGGYVEYHDTPGGGATFAIRIALHTAQPSGQTATVSGAHQPAPTHATATGADHATSETSDGIPPPLPRRAEN